MWSTVLAYSILKSLRDVCSSIAVWITWNEFHCNFSQFKLFIVSSVQESYESRANKTTLLIQFTFYFHFFPSIPLTNTQQLLSILHTRWKKFEVRKNLFLLTFGSFQSNFDTLEGTVFDIDRKLRGITHQPLILMSASPGLWFFTAKTK